MREEGGAGSCDQCSESGLTDHCRAFLAAVIGGAAAKLNAFMPWRMEAAAPAAGALVELATVTLGP